MIQIQYILVYLCLIEEARRQSILASKEDEKLKNLEEDMDTSGWI